MVQTPFLELSPQRVAAEVGLLVAVTIRLLLAEAAGQEAGLDIHMRINTITAQAQASLAKDLEEATPWAITMEEAVEVPVGLEEIQTRVVPAEMAASAVREFRPQFKE